MQHDFFSHVKPLALTLVSSDADGVINGVIAFLRSRWSKWSATDFDHVMISHQHHMIPTASFNWCITLMLAPILPLAQEIISLNNHLNMTNAMASFMAPSATCDRRLLPCMCQKQMFPSNATCASLFMCTYETIMSVHMPHMNVIPINNVTRDTDIHTLHIICHMPPSEYACNISYICPTILILLATCRPHTTAHTGKKQQQTAMFIYHSIRHICANKKYAPKMPFFT